MKLVLNVVGVVFFLMAIIWILQGTGMLPYGFMANDMKWAILGQTLEIPAVGLLLFANINPGR